MHLFLLIDDSRVVLFLLVICFFSLRLDIVNILSVLLLAQCSAVFICMDRNLAQNIVH